LWVRNPALGEGRPKLEIGWALKTPDRIVGYRPISPLADGLDVESVWYGSLFDGDGSV
jgi:hypothetical protein